jgi:hypothetical protein
MPETAERIKYADVFVVRTQTIEQLAFLLDWFDVFARSNPCWKHDQPKHWSPWPLSPDSDPEERWILVNSNDDGEEHPSGTKYVTAQEALNAADKFNEEAAQ